MSYDVAFFHDTAKCKHSSYAAYCRLRRGLGVPGLRKLKRQAVVSALSDVLTVTDTTKNRVAGHLGNALVEATLLDDAVMVDLRNMVGNEVTQLEEAMRQLELWLFDPQTYHYNGDTRAEIYDLTYEEESEDPDPRYWVDLDLRSDSMYEIGGSLIGLQEINDIRYAFYGASFNTIKDAVDDSQAWLTAETLTHSAFTGGDSITALVHLPAAVVEQLASGHNARMFLTGFTAFANDDDVIRYEHWGPDLDGRFAGIYSLPTVPTKVKTVISQRYCYKG